MEWLKTILPLFGVLVGWLLSEGGKLFADKKQNKRKLNKLLFYLLELRYRFARQLSLENDMNKYLEVLKKKLNEMGVDVSDSEVSEGNIIMKPMIEKLIEEIKQETGDLGPLSTSIDTILNELSEVDPFLAYELNGQHNIKGRLESAKNYISNVKSLENKIPFDIGDIINPKLTKELLNDLEDSIDKIAGRVGKKIRSAAKAKINKMDMDDDKDMEKMLQEYLLQVQAMLNQNH